MFITKYSKAEKKCKMHLLFSRQVTMKSCLLIWHLWFRLRVGIGNKIFLSLLIMVIVESFYLAMYYLPYLFAIFRHILHWIFSLPDTLGRTDKESDSLFRFYSPAIIREKRYILLIWRIHCFGKLFKDKFLVCSEFHLELLIYII